MECGPESEAVTMHAIPREHVRKTGAQLYDHWFEMKPTLSRDAFCARAGGLDPNKPIILYLCSSSFICPDEVAFVREWLAGLRNRGDALAGANVIVRPHPAHLKQWQTVDLSTFGNAVIWPRAGGVPVDDERKHDYFHSLFHAEAVVGINTSGFIEAGILGRRTLAPQSGHFNGTQSGTLHFRYLTPLLTVSPSLAQHFSELEHTIVHKETTKTEVIEFITDFVRPGGLVQPATPIFIEAVENAAKVTPKPWRVPLWAPWLRLLISPWAWMFRRHVLTRTNGAVFEGVERSEFPRFVNPHGDSTADLTPK